MKIISLSITNDETGIGTTSLYVLLKSTFTYLVVDTPQNLQTSSAKLWFNDGSFLLEPALPQIAHLVLNIP